MMLHNNQHNLEREWRGEPVLNSLWFWGCGCLPENPDTGWSMIVSDDPVAGGLAELSGIPRISMPDDPGVVLDDNGATGDVLIIRDDLHVKASYQDLNSWEEIMYVMEDRWFTTLLDALKQGDLDGLKIITGGIEYKINRHSLKKFWARKRPVM